MTDEKENSVIEIPQVISSSSKSTGRGKDAQSRKYQLTINNPLTVEVKVPKGTGGMMESPFHHDRIKENLRKLTTIVYWCMADEIGLNGETPHTYLFRGT